MSSGSESDEDFVPGEPEKVSEEESADDETDKQYEHELEHKAKKRKGVEDSKAKKRRKSAKKPKPDSESEEEKEDMKPLNPEEEKKRSDDLWAMFLEGTDTKPKPKEAVNNTQTTKQNSVIEKPQTAEVKAVDVKEADAKEKEKRIFEFAGETIVVENNVIKEKFKSCEAPEKVNKLSVGPSRSRAGLSSVLGQLNKKNKLSTLEKSKLDWETYKKEHGIEEEVEKHNKGKDGYLDRQDFLERADLRQFEIERDLRITRRSNR